MRATWLDPRGWCDLDLSSHVMWVWHLKRSTLAIVTHWHGIVEHGVRVGREYGAGWARLEWVHVVAWGGGEEHDLARSHQRRCLERRTLTAHVNRWNRRRRRRRPLLGYGDWIGRYHG